MGELGDLQLLRRQIYYQQVRGATPLEAGLLLAPQGVGAMLGTLFVGRVRSART